MSKRRAATAEMPSPATDDAPGRCSVTESVDGTTHRCTRDVEIKQHGMCWAHYVRFTRTGKPGPVAIRTRRKLRTYRPRAK